MSADNGIYILETKSNPRRSFPEVYEYRVAHLQAIDNVDWDDTKKRMCKDPDIQIKNARYMWKNCEVFTSKIDALFEAQRLENNCIYTEYGICTITIPRHF